MEEIRLLSKEDIDVRVAQTNIYNNNGQQVVKVNLLLYKNARVDMKILDELFTPMGWKRTHKLIGDRLYCCVEVFNEMKEVSEDVMLESIKFAHEEIKKHCRIQKELNKELGKDVKRDYPHDEEDEDLKKKIHDFAYDKCYALAKSARPKHEREDGFEAIKKECVESLGLTEEEQDAKKMMINRYFGHEQREALRNLVLDEGLRVDGRQTTQVRPIWCEVDCLPCAHGSAIFTRGETQALASVTLGTKMDMKEMDEVLVQETQQFVLHYNFPPFATGEAKAQRGVGRREVGHGNLAFRALKAVMPKAPEFPYAVRVVSDILESNGSSSQASICGGCLALMDAGVQISKPVAGVAMGLITDENNPNGRYAILTDILGDEDHLGDMDFKVAGTKDGITATQMDIKVDGLSYEVLAKALQQAHEGRMHIMGEMMKCLDKPREDYKPFVPRIKSFWMRQCFLISSWANLMDSSMTSSGTSFISPSTIMMFSSVAATISSRSAFSVSLKVGLILNSPSILATRTSEIGPRKGRSLVARAAEAARPARASGWMSFSAETSQMLTNTARWKSSGNNGLRALSTRREIRIS